jgi:hypothetical protein
MARCSHAKKSARTGITILVCDLDENHQLAYPKHFDKKEMITWQHANNNPQPVPETRTSKKSTRAATASVAAHTTQFEVLNV